MLREGCSKFAGVPEVLRKGCSKFAGAAAELVTFTAAPPPLVGAVFFLSRPMKNRLLVPLLAACGLLLGIARPALGQGPVFTEALGISPGVAGGGSFGLATAINAAGDQYVTGKFYGTLVLGSTTLVSTGTTDTFVAKRSGRTGGWLWAVRAGGTSYTYGQSVAVDAGGNALVTGLFYGMATFGTGPAATRLIAAGGYDIFVAKFASADGAAAWAVRAGGTNPNSDGGYGVAVDAGGNALVTGLFYDVATFGTGPATVTLGVSGSSGPSAFVAKFAGADGAVAWAVRAGSPGSTLGAGVAVDAGGNALVTGGFGVTTTFATSPTATVLASAGYLDVFVAKFGAATGAVVWAVGAGGPNGDDVGTGVAVDAGGNALVTGYFRGTATFGTRPVATGLVSAGADDVFVAKFAGTDGVAAWAVRAGGNSNNRDVSRSVAVDAGGNALVTGSFAGTATFATRPTATRLTAGGYTDAFVAKFGAADGTAAWAVQAGGAGEDEGDGVAVDAGGNVLVVGSFEGSANFGSLALVGGTRGRTGFAAKLGAAGPSATATGRNEARLTLAPNPARAAATLALPAAAHPQAVTVADALGRVVRRAALPAQTTTLALDVAGLAPGVYTVRCAAATARLVVE